MSAGLTAFSMQGVNMDYVVNYIREKYDIVIRTIGSNQAGTAGIRVSTNIYVTMEDINKLLEGIREVANKS
jgi:selenocysteine lyase/cysteine desulfurase